MSQNLFPENLAGFDSQTQLLCSFDQNGTIQRVPGSDTLYDWIGTPSYVAKGMYNNTPPDLISARLMRFKEDDRQNGFVGPKMINLRMAPRFFQDSMGASIVFQVGTHLPSDRPGYGGLKGASFIAMNTLLIQLSCSSLALTIPDELIMMLLDLLGARQNRSFVDANILHDLDEDDWICLGFGFMPPDGNRHILPYKPYVTIGDTKNGMVVISVFSTDPPPPDQDPPYGYLFWQENYDYATNDDGKQTPKADAATFDFSYLETRIKRIAVYGGLINEYGLYELKNAMP